MSSGLFHTLNIGSEALYTTRQGVDTAGHNIANAQTEGFSRQKVNIAQRDPLASHGVLIGNGVYVGSITRAHDRFIEDQLNKAHQEAGRAGMRSDAMHNLEGIFSPEQGASVTDEVSKFFGSLQTLGSFPADFTVRTSVVEAAKDLASSFRRVDSQLNESREGINEQVEQTTAKVSDSLKEIASLNVKIQGAEAGQGESANDLRDQRDRLVRDLSKQIEVKYYEDQHGMLFVRGPNQVTLVDGGHAATVGVLRNTENNGLFDVTVRDWEGHSTRNVTGKMDGGALEAMVQMRDVDVPGLINKNNQMAYAVATEVNAAHQQGYGIGEFAEKAGRNFFKAPEGVHNAAASMEIDDAIAESNNAIAAASTPMAPGDNVNLNNLLRIKDAKIFAEQNTNLGEFYANYTGALGLDVQRAGHIKEASDLVVQDLNTRRESVSGVSLDEEATNMMKWQANFTASSKLITTVDEMMDTILQLKR